MTQAGKLWRHGRRAVFEFSRGKFLHVQRREAAEMPGVGGQQRNSQSEGTGGYQAIGNPHAIGKVVFLHPSIRSVSDFRREFDNLDFMVVEKPPKKAVFLFVPAPFYNQDILSSLRNGIVGVNWRKKRLDPVDLENPGHPV